MQTKAGKHGRSSRGKKPPFSLEAILEQPAARGALDGLGPDISKDRLFKFLKYVAVNWELNRSPRSHWQVLTGMERHTLRRLPSHVKVLASKIERANSHPLLNIATIFATLQKFSRLTDAEHEVLALIQDTSADFERLPSILTTYSDFLEALNRVAGHGVAKNRRLRDGRKLCECALLEYVRRCTGKYHFSEVAILLNAACWAYGIEEANYAPSALDAARKRTPKILEPVIKALSEG